MGPKDKNLIETEFDEDLDIILEPDNDDNVEWVNVIIELVNDGYDIDDLLGTESQN